MNVLSLLLTLCACCLPTWVWLERLVPTALPARRLLLAGYSLLLGMIGITLIMRLLSALDIAFSIGSIGLAAAIVMLAGWFAPEAWRISESTSNTAPPHAAPTRWYYLVLAVCLALIAFRLIALGVEVSTRPTFAWDALQHWSKQAKVFYELGSTAPYVPFDQWLSSEGESVYTNVHPDYPITTPLLQAWTSTFLGQWHDSLVNIPWLLMYIALGLIFYSQARIAGLDTLSAAAGTYMLASLPYLNTHVALAGYADLLLSACYLGAFAAFANWSVNRSHGQAALMILSATACLLIKNEGFYWLLSLIPGIALALMGIRRGFIVIGSLAIALLLLLAILPEDLVIAGHTLAATSLQYRPEGLMPIALSFLVHDNWHFLAYLFVAALVLLPLLGRATVQSLTPAGAVILAALMLYLLLYLMTSFSQGAVVYTSLNRVALQLMPAVGFFTLLAYGAQLERCRVSTATQVTAPAQG